MNATLFKKQCRRIVFALGLIIGSRASWASDYYLINNIGTGFVLGHSLSSTNGIKFDQLYALSDHDAPTNSGQGLWAGQTDTETLGPSAGTFVAIQYTGPDGITR